MATQPRPQLLALGLTLAAYALLVFFAYLVTPFDQLVAPGQQVPEALLAIPHWQLAGANAGFVLVPYALLGLAGYWFARKLQLPELFREQGGWKVWVLRPLVLGLAVGGVIVLFDQILVLVGSNGFPHPAFPFSVIASGTAGIGEEILFRGLVMGLWGFLLSLVLRGPRGRTAALWIGNGVAALASSAAHIPAAMILLNVSRPTQLPALTWIELFVLNGLMGLVAGERRMKDGLVAAMGIHFWADIVWHVLWPMSGLGA